MFHHHHPIGATSDCDRCAAAANPAKLRRLWIALIVISTFSVAEVWTSSLSHSVALLADAGHVVSDSVALAAALLAAWIAQLPASSQAPFGYRRVEILAALANGLGLVAIALWIGWEAIATLQRAPSDILSLPMMVTAAVGLLVNSLNALLLHDHSHDDLNVRGAFLHMVADAIGSLGILLGGLLIWAFQWMWVDGVISLAIAAMIITGALPLIRQSVNILLEKTPPHLDTAQIQTRLLQVAGVVGIEQLRVWAIAPGHDALAAHVLVDVADGIGRDRLLQEIQAILQQDFGIDDSVLQL
ncbi:MAG TPA: cation diffusion facilitator family transporter, partial [Chroococcidiopsis sp.]